MDELEKIIIKILERAMETRISDDGIVIKVYTPMIAQAVREWMEKEGWVKTSTCKICGGANDCDFICPRHETGTDCEGPK